MNHKRDTDELLAGIGTKIRENRQQRGLTVKALSAASELSSRFINQLETGKANISISALFRIAQAFELNLHDLIASPVGGGSARDRVWKWISESSPENIDELAEWIDLRARKQATPKFVGLIGLRGSGKSTIGAMLARRLKMDFVELDSWIEDLAGMRLGEIFSMHGEEYYRRLERQALDRLFNSGSRNVFAPGGSIVTDQATWERIKRSCVTVGLHATAEELLKRMRRQGDTRPMLGRPSASVELKALLARRDPVYAESDILVETTGRTPTVITSEIINLIRKPERFVKQ